MPRHFKPSLRHMVFSVRFNARIALTFGSLRTVKTKLRRGSVV
jgi:hypothetical protein